MPFGTALNAESSGSTNRRFTTYDRSLNTGLDYAINRHYDPQQGRFTQVDPIGMGSVSLESPQTLNLYAYCTNDPINQIDPSGLGFLGKLFKAIGKAIKIIAIVLVVVVVVALLIYAAPAGAALIHFAEFLLFKAAPVLAKVLAGLTGFHTGSITLGPGGTPTWNPKAGKIGGFGWDDTTDVIRTTTSCRNNWPAPDGPNCPGAPWYKKVWREVVGGIAVAIALGQVSYGRLAALEQRFGMWFLKRMDEGSPKVQIGTYANGDPIYMGFAVGGIRTPSTAFGRSIQSLKAGDAAWQRGAFSTDVSTRYRGATSIEEAFTNIATGERIYRHTIVREGKLLHETFRTYSKTGLK